MKHEIQVLNKTIPEDEPLFLLRGQDKLAPAAIFAYADELECTASDDGVAPDEALRRRELANEAEAAALAIERWQLEHPDRTKMPD